MAMSQHAERFSPAPKRRNDAPPDTQKRIHPATVLQRVQHAPHAMSSEDVVTLQRAIGNHATDRLLQSFLPSDSATRAQSQLSVQRKEMAGTRQPSTTPSRYARPPISSSGPTNSPRRRTFVVQRREQEREEDLSSAEGTSQTGLPVSLKQGVEALSGFDLSDVRVHYNSAKPAAVQAKAYAHGSDIHLGPGQEHHLPHEAWHVVQQKQGRVRGRWQAKGLAVNDDVQLEREADVMGARANTMRTAGHALAGLQSGVAVSRAPIQMVKEDEFKANPETFLRDNILTLDFLRGLTARAPALGKKNQDFLGKFHSFPRHWFRLVADEGRSTPEKGAYLLTPAIEKYVAAYPDDVWLAEVGRMEGMPVAASEDEYIQSAYVQYLTKKVNDLDADVGHTSIVKDKETDGFNPDFVFTDVMNGCAFTITEGEDDEHFTAWHFQSPGSNKGKASEFRRDKDPLDWFGEEEYDSNQHKGLFETTNLLWRSDNAWKILSQANDIDAYDRDKVHSSTFKSRALNLDSGGGGKLGMLQRIYSRYGENQYYEAERYYINALKAKLDRALEISIRTVCDTVLLHIQADIKAINDATTILALNGVATTRLQERTTAESTVNEQVDPLVESLEALYARENTKWFPDRAHSSRLNQSIGNLRDLKGVFAKKSWLSELRAETA